jgi:hypothetical protein
MAEYHLDSDPDSDPDFDRANSHCYIIWKSGSWMWVFRHLGHRLGEDKRLRCLNAYPQPRHLAGVMMNACLRLSTDRLT